jgi:hypothetical protein
MSGYRRLARFNKKGPTHVKAPYMTFAPHTGEFPLYNDESVSEFYGRPGETFTQIMAIDPGIKNCGICIQRFWSSGYVEVVMLARINFLIGDTPTSDTVYYTNALKVLKQLVPIMSISQYILIESQLPINYDMVRMSSHIISFLMSSLEDNRCKPIICEVDAYFKSRIFNAPPKMKKPELKKWCWEYAMQILKDRNDMKSHDLIHKSGKKDDLSDAFLYCIGWYKAMNEGIQTIKKPCSVN